MTCPRDIRKYADWGRNYTTITWPPVIASDNSGEEPNVTSIGVASIYYIGKHQVFYNATDQAGNYKICTFYITVEGEKIASYLNLDDGGNFILRDFLAPKDIIHYMKFKKINVWSLQLLFIYIYMNLSVKLFLLTFILRPFQNIINGKSGIRFIG